MTPSRQRARIGSTLTTLVGLAVSGCLAAPVLAAGPGVRLKPAASPHAEPAAPAAPATPAPAAEQAPSPAEAARQLLDHGQAQFPQWFPGPQPSHRWGPFVFRHYPETGVYLGVALDTNPDYAVGGVYLMGGLFGNQPVHAGPLTSFITPQPAGRAEAARSNGCMDQMLARDKVPGARWTLVQQDLQPPGEVWTIDTQALGPTTFQAQPVFETLVRIAPGIFPEGLTSRPDVLETRLFFQHSGANERLHVGNNLSYTEKQRSGDFVVESFIVVNSTLSPPAAESSYTVAMADTATVSTAMQSKVSVTMTSPGLPPSQQSETLETDFRSSTRLLRRETVSVPAGTFAACVFEDTTTGVEGVTTRWLLDGVGVELKSVVSEGGRDTTRVTTMIWIDGAPIAR